MQLYFNAYSKNGVGSETPFMAPFITVQQRSTHFTSSAVRFFCEMFTTVILMATKARCRTVVRLNQTTYVLEEPEVPQVTNHTAVEM